MSLKIVCYNIQYGIKSTKLRHYLYPHKYVKKNKTAHEIGQNLKQYEPDVIGLIEVDSGSRGYKQCQTIASYTKCKHPNSVNKYQGFRQKLPYFKNQHNTILTKEPHEPDNMYFSKGTKKAIVVSKLKEFTLVLVHLSLRKKVREKQILDLCKIILDNSKLVIMGDFNCSKKELQKLHDFGLTRANTTKTFPSWKPKRDIDHIFVSSDVTINNEAVLPIVASDHLPILVEVS